MTLYFGHCARKTSYSKFLKFKKIHIFQHSLLFFMDKRSRCHVKLGLHRLGRAFVLLIRLLDYI